MTNTPLKMNDWRALYRKENSIPDNQFIHDEVMLRFIVSKCPSPTPEPDKLIQTCKTCGIFAFTVDGKMCMNGHKWIDESHEPPQGIKSKEKVIDVIISQANGSWKDIAEQAYDAGLAASQFPTGYSREDMGIELRRKLRAFMIDVRKPTSKRLGREEILINLTESILNSLTNK